MEFARRHWSQHATISCSLCVSFVASGACGNILDVKRPDIVQESELTTAAGLAALRAGAFGEFAKAYGGDASAPGDVRENQILATGALGDEFKALETDATRIIYDARRTNANAPNGNLENFYLALQRARSAAETAANGFRKAALPNADSVVAETLTLAGFIYTFLGEDYCSGVPISRLNDAGEIEYGKPQTNAELFQGSVAKFDSAIASAQKARATNVLQLAQVGKGRALLNLGQFQQAASAVTSVPTSFRYDIRYASTTPRQQNGVFYANNQLKRWSMTNKKGVNGIDYQDAFTAGDPRTPWAAMPGDGLGFDKTAGPGFNQMLYTSLTSPIPLATGIEARLIEAEAALNASDFTAFQNIHNAVRATLNRPAVGPINASSMTAAQRVDFHFRERALWMYATGHRLGDMRRLIRQYGRTENTVFPTGPYYRPNYPTFGTDVNFPIPVTELNNPNFTACLDRRA